MEEGKAPIDADTPNMREMSPQAPRPYVAPPKPPRFEFTLKQVSLFKKLTQLGWDVCWCFEDAEGGYEDDDMPYDWHEYDTTKAEEYANDQWEPRVPCMKVRIK